MVCPSPLVAVVDDQLLLLEVMREVLAAAGYRVRTSVDVEQGFEFVSSCQPDVAILDAICNGRAVGVETVRRMKSDIRLAGIPVILCSGATELFRSELTGFPTVWTLAKPFDVEELLAALGKALPRPTVA